MGIDIVITSICRAADSISGSQQTYKHVDDLYYYSLEYRYPNL